MLKKDLAILFSLGASMASAQAIVHQSVDPNGVTQVHTALEHLSIIALPEKIIRVAAGSDAVQVEWHDSNVFIKPVKNGLATNLMVWTEHQFSAYELAAPGPVSDMTIVLDESKSPVPKTTASSEAGEKAAAEQQQRISDSIIGSTLLDATPVVAHGLHPAKDFVSVVINEVVRDKDSVYIRFAVTNNSPHPYRILSPTVLAITPQRNVNLVPALKDLQISDQVLAQFQSVQTDPVTVRGYSVSNRDVDPGKTVEGVLTIQPKEVDKPVVYEFVFANDGKHPTSAAAVL
jgi:Conjugal transfer protein